MNKQTFIIGFMLFALFFGAGNLIYPPTLGLESGTSYWSAISGFVMTGVGLPILAVAAIAFVKSDPQELSNRVHPVFGITFTSLVYLAIGPFFGIPRAASVAYEMSLEPFVNNSGWLMLLYTTIFFLIVLAVSLNPSKMVDRIGQLLTPILLFAMIILFVGTYIGLDTSVSGPIEKYTTTPLLTGFVEGYLTMDAMSALAFGIVVVTAFKSMGITNKSKLLKETLKAGAVTGIGLTAVYISIGWIGTQMGAAGTFANGGDIIAAAAELVFGSFGALLLGVIVALACLTTSVGLVAATGQFFSEITRLSYRTVVIVVTLASFLIANQGLETIINVSVPVLEFLYPIAIVIILLAFLHPFLSKSQGVYRGAVAVTAVFSLYDGFGIEFSVLEPIMARLPLFEAGLGWLIPAIIGAITGHLLARPTRDSKQ